MNASALPADQPTAWHHGRLLESTRCYLSLLDRNRETGTYAHREFVSALARMRAAHADAQAHADKARDEILSGLGLLGGL